jgi:FKBP-type peptidyl-prolyl cis-trans isomerase
MQISPRNFQIAVIGIAIIAIVGLFLASNVWRPAPADSATATQNTSNTQTSNQSTAPTREGAADFITTASGLQYRVIAEGTGPRPTAVDSVRVHYRGTLEDGTVFDSSYDRGEPISFSLGGVIAGWTEGLQLMPVGSTYEFVIPSDLGYGAAGFPPVIPPNATLIFQVELLAIE